VGSTYTAVKCGPLSHRSAVLAMTTVYLQGRDSSVSSGDSELSCGDPKLYVHMLHVCIVAVTTALVSMSVLATVTAGPARLSSR
jgi:hypothetical protein